MSAGMDALTISKLLPPGKSRTHVELIKAAGFGGARMRDAIALASREGLIASRTVRIAAGSEKGSAPEGSHAKARRAAGWRSIQCWEGESPMLDSQDWRGEHLIRAMPRERRHVKDRTPLSARQAMVYAEIEKRQPVQSLEMKGALELSWPQISSCIMEMITKGYVTRQGRRNGTLRVIP